MVNRNIILLISLLFFSLFNIIAFESLWGEELLPNAANITERANTHIDQGSAAMQTPESINNKAVETQTEKDKESNEGHTAITTYDSNPLAAKAVDRSISLFSDRIRERFSIWLERSGRYLEVMRDILRAKSIPEDIAFLPIIESGFNPQAYSAARAVGPWQFIAGTAKRYGLKVDWWTDERKDPLKSTEAAADYLKDLYGMFGSWNLAMAAYNAGEGKILKALSRTKTDNYWALLNTKHIRRETKEYVPRFIAASMIANNPQNYGFENLDYHSPLQYDEVILDRPVDIDIAARCAETTPASIRELNPELRRWSTPPNVASYTLRIPAGRKDIFMENFKNVPEEELFSISTYAVKKGDTIKAIAKKAGVPVSVLLELNGDGIGPLRVGEKIYLPPKNKFFLDRDDKVRVKKAKYKGKQSGKKILVTNLSRKDAYVND